MLLRIHQRKKLDREEPTYFEILNCNVTKVPLCLIKNHLIRKVVCLLHGGRGKQQEKTVLFTLKVLCEEAMTFILMGILVP